MTMNVVDVSRYQGAESIAAMGADSAITGLTYGNVGVNPYGADELAQTAAAGMMRGVYHIRAGDGPTPQAEAQHFLDNAAPYLDGRTIPFLDWEECNLGDVGWALAWLMYVYTQTGIRPVIYMSSSVSLAYDWSPVYNAGFALWVAQYPYDTVAGFQGVNWTPPQTGWPAIIGWQYAGTGGSAGPYTGIDLSVFFLTVAQWVAFATPTLNPQSSDIIPIKEKDMPLNDADKEWIGNKLYEVLQDPVVVEAQRKLLINDETLRNIQGTILPDLATHAQALWNGIQGTPAAVLNQPFTANGRSVNVAGLLAALDAKPAAQITLDAAGVQAIAEQLHAALPAAVVTALTALAQKVVA